MAFVSFRNRLFLATKALMAVGCLLSGSVWAQDVPWPNEGTPTTPPSFNPDSCSLSEIADYLFFESGSSDSLVGRNAPERLKEIAALWKIDPGYVLIEAHSDSAETASKEGANIALRRAEWVRDQFAATGIPINRIWLRSWNSSKPMIVVPPGMPAAENRRVEVSISGRGRRCVAHLHQRELRWLQNSCLGPSASAKEDVCRRFLDKVITTFQYP